MIPMRDGVKLHTVILIPSPLFPSPRGKRERVRAKGGPILLTRTPYQRRQAHQPRESAHLGPVLHGYDNPWR